MSTLIATIEGIRTLTRSILDATATAETGRGTYLRSLVRETQKELGAPARARGRGAGRPLDEEAQQAQLAALATVHGRFYEAVLEVCGEGLKGPDRAQELNRRSNFARTAYAAARGWVRAGNDLTRLAAERVTKNALQVDRAARTVTPRSLARRVERGVTELIERAEQLAANDKAAAVSALEQAMARIANSLAALASSSATRDPAKALAERIPLRTRHGTFVPVGAGAA